MNAAASPPSWLEVTEKGNALAIRVMLMLCQFLGRRVARLMLHPVVAYFMAVSPSARRTSREYLTRMGLPHGMGAVYRHCMRFARCTLDRVFWAAGRTSLFEVTRRGGEHLAAVRQSGRGALLFGAHLGSFESMRAMASVNALPLNIVGYFKNARLITAVIERLNPRLAMRVIPVEPGIDFVLRLKERIEAGEIVALLADRVGLGDRTVEVDFLGGKILLPAGPYMLAAMLRCPVYLTFGLSLGTNRYDLYCEPFADQITLARQARQADAQAYAQRFAQRLEHYCRLAPDNWFNFHQVWR
ncbi:MAG: lipid A biosynthesis acyltransferase [Bacteroidota bacterium]